MNLICSAEVVFCHRDVYFAEVNAASSCQRITACVTYFRRFGATPSAATFALEFINQTAILIYFNQSEGGLSQVSQ